MKNKVGLIVGAIAVAALAVAGYLFISKPGMGPKLSYQIDAKKEAAQSLARYVPKNVVAFYSLNNVEKVWTELRGSDFWKEFSNLKIWQDANVQTTMQNFQTEFKKSLGFELGEGTIMDLIGKELVIAVLPMEAESQQPNILFLSEVGGKTKVAEQIFKMIETSRSEGAEATPVKTERVNFGSAEIVHVIPNTPEDPDVYYTLLDNSMIVGLGNTRAALENAINVHDEKSEDSLAKNEAFQNLISKTTLGENTIGRFYMDFGQVGSLIEALSAIPGTGPLAPNVTNAFASLKTLGGTTVLDKGLMTRIEVTPNKEKMDSQTRSMWETQPAKPESLALVPSGTYLYSTSCSLDVSGMWDLWLNNLSTQNAQQAQLIQDGIRSFEQSMGVEIKKDILSWIGNEAAYVFNEVSTGGLFPIPKMAILVKVTDKGAAQKFLDKLVDGINKQTAAVGEEQEGETASALPGITGFQLQMAEENYKGSSLNLLELPFLGKSLAPGYAFVGDFLVISSNAEALKKMIDTYKGDNPSLEKDENFQNAAKVIERKTNQIVYVNMSKMMDAGVEISNWIATFQALQPTEEGQANQAFIQESLIPLLKSLKAISTIGVNTVYTSDGIEQTFFTDFQSK